MTLKLFQKVWNEIPTNRILKTDAIFNIIQLGIQAPPGTQVIFGEDLNTESVITIGNTGIFSIEVNDAIILQGPIQLILPTTTNAILNQMPAIVDAIYIAEGGNG